MNREILFKAKRVCGDEWVEGYYLNCYYPGNSTEQTGYFIVEYPGKYHEIYLKTLCQYTGLTDRNGRKIFEGDIVRGLFDGEKITGYITYGSNAQYYIERNGLYGISLDNAQDWIEVIGNIFDNPELIEN